MLVKLFWLCTAGSLGTMARYGLSGLVHNPQHATLPWGTLTVNITGCFLAGLLWPICEQLWPAGSQMRTIIFIGFFGAFTTFSALILETGVLAKSAQLGNAVIYLTMQNVLGLVALYVGWMIGKLMLPAS